MQPSCAYKHVFEKRKEKERKRSDRNITPILSSKLPDLMFFRLVVVGLSEWAVSLKMTLSVTSVASGSSLL